MQLLVTKLLITLLAIVVCKSAAVKANNVEGQVDQIAEEARPAKVTLQSQKYVTVKPPELQNQSTKRPQTQYQPYLPYPQKQPAYSQLMPSFQLFKPQYAPPKYGNPPPKSVQINSHQRPYPSIPSQYVKTKQQLSYSASTARPLVLQTIQSPKFSLPVYNVNGIPAVKSPIQSKNKSVVKVTLSSTSTTTTTTTPKPMRTKRIWPKHMAVKLAQYNITVDSRYIDNTTTDSQVAESFRDTLRTQFRTTQNTTFASTTTAAAPRVYKRVTRKTKTHTTPTPTNLTLKERDEGWVPIMPSHFGHPMHSASRRSSRGKIVYLRDSPPSRRVRYIPTYGFLPHKQVGRFPKTRTSSKTSPRKKRKPNLKTHVYSGYRGRIIRRPSDPHMLHLFLNDLEPQQSKHPIMKIKHHHHHHHHKYIKTIDKPVKVPYKVEIPKPYPVEKKVPVPYPVEKVVHKIIEKKVPVPYPVEKKVPVTVEVKVPAPYPVKVIEKEYVDRPVPVVHHVPVMRPYEVRVPHPVPVPVERHIPVPVRVNVPVDRPVPYPVPVEKQVAVPVPVRVLIPHPYPVERKVPYPVEVKVKEPVIQQVPVKVYVPKPYPVSVPRPYPVEKKVPYPVEVEKRIPVPVKVFVPQPIPVERKVPIFLHHPIPIHQYTPTQLPPTLITADPHNGGEAIVSAGLTVSDNFVTNSPTSDSGSSHHEVTIHGNGAFTGFSNRLDKSDLSSTAAPS